MANELKFCLLDLASPAAAGKRAKGVRSAIRKKCWPVLACLLAGFFLSRPLPADDFKLVLSPEINRHWPGPDFFASNFEDWEIKGGSLQCLTPAVNRYVFFLTQEIEGQTGQFQAGFKAKVNLAPSRPRLKNYLGLRLGIKGRNGDYKQAAVAGQGIDLGLTTDGLLFIGDLESVSSIETQEIIRETLKTGVLFKINLDITPGGYRLKLSLSGAQSGKLLDELEDTGPEIEKVQGGLALVASLPEAKTGSGGLSVGEFQQVELQGELLKTHPERQLGPVAFTLYSLSGRQLKLRAQLIPGSFPDKGRLALDIKDGGQWLRVASEKIEASNSGVLFSIKDWQPEQEVDFRLRLLDENQKETGLPPFFGRIVSRPAPAGDLKLAALTGGSEADYPYSGVVAGLKKLDPEILFFGGNQVFGRPAAWWQEPVPVERLKQEYLRQWILFGWAFSELLKDRPAIIIPDARDYFQLKLWGDGGKIAAAEKARNLIEGQDSGGFLLPADFISLVLETQTSHLPDSPGKELAGTGLKPYYCQVNYGGLSLAVLDDRMFKTPPASVLPGAQIRNGWPENPAFKAAKEARAKGASLHGQEQLDFLRRWAEDWSGQVEFKAALSQSLWACLETIPAGMSGDEALFKSPLPPAGEYPSSDQPAADFNSGGWPDEARDEAVRILRKALAVHLAGSGGPPASLKYGLSKYEEAGYAFLPKTLLSSWPVRWYPPKSKASSQSRSAATGNFTDAFGNRFTVKAVANPVASLADRSSSNTSGFGLVRFRQDGTIVFENWPAENPGQAKDAGPLPGWPVVCSLLDNDGRRPAGYLPVLRFKGIDNPVVQVVEEASGEIVYTLRIRGNEFRPPVFRAGNYTVRCGQPGTGNWKELKKISSLPAGAKKVRLVDFTSRPPGK